MQCTKSVDSSGIEVNKCRKKTGSTRCGTGCTGIKTALENLQKLEEKREAKRRKAERREAEKREAERPALQQASNGQHDNSRDDAGPPLAYKDIDDRR